MARSGELREVAIRLRTGPDQHIWVSVPSRETACAGLFATPCATADADGHAVLVGGWWITHRITGLALTSRVFDELEHAVLFAEVLATHGVDFDTAWVTTDPAAEPALAATDRLVTQWIAQLRAA